MSAKQILRVRRAVVTGVFFGAVLASFGSRVKADSGGPARLVVVGEVPYVVLEAAQPAPANPVPEPAPSDSPFLLVPRWEIGRDATALLPKYLPGSATLLLVKPPLQTGADNHASESSSPLRRKQSDVPLLIPNPPDRTSD